MHPWINREVKCAFRWYRSPKLRHRYRFRLNDEGPPTGAVYSLPFPARTILPFQALLSDGTTGIASWVLKALDGTIVADLSDHIPSLAIGWYSNPGRAIVCLEKPIVLLSLPEGLHEMEITTLQGEVVYSETFELLAACNGPMLPNSDMAGGAMHWSAGNVTRTISVVGVPATAGSYIGEQVINLADNLLYEWNGTIWLAYSPVNGSYYGLGVNGPWYVYSGGGWASPATPPLYFGAPSTCWQGVGSSVNISYHVPASHLPGLVRLRFTIWRGSPILGSITVIAGAETLGTFTEADNGAPQDFLVLLNPGDRIEFRGNPGFNGCLNRPVFNAIADGSDCMTRLEWMDCGDLGTVAYTIGSGQYRNILYLRDAGTSMQAAVNDPVPQVEEEVERGQDGSSTAVRRRKEVEWRLELGYLPWHVIDALSEMVITGTRLIRVPWGDGADLILAARMETQWSNKDALATGAVLFRVDEATAASGCCALFDRPCPDPCVEAVGIADQDELVEGSIYLLNDGRAALYCGPDCTEPVDERYFRDHVQCPQRMALLGGRLVMWDGSQWVSAVDLFSVEAQDGCATYSIIAIIPVGYLGRIEWTSNGADWYQAGAPFTSSQGAMGLVIERPPGAMYLRVVAMGYECDLAPSLAVPAPCACPRIDFIANLEANCGSLPTSVTIAALPFDSESNQILMPGLGEEVTMFYRIDGGSWVPMEVQTPGAPNNFYAINGVPYTTAGEELEVMLFFTDRPWCESQVSQVFSCPE